jgi:tRNA-2-methylthio-N6-dimethylallyladenosine synthase
MVSRLLKNRDQSETDTDFPPESKFDSLPEESKPQGPAAFLTIQEGCDKFCTFCVVPYTRGAEFSRPVQEVIAEAKKLVLQGTREITLLGQNVNAYHGESPSGSIWDLSGLIRELATIDGLNRIRFTTSHPRDMNDDLIKAFAEVPALMPYLHLPVQSGSDATLKRMNRGHNRDSYFTIVEKLRSARPDLALSSDFIVGFPGETNADFDATMDLVEKVGFAQAYSFKYSPRPGTPAASQAEQVSEELKSERLSRLQGVLNDQQYSFNNGMSGCFTDVLFDRKGRKPGQIVGRSPWLQATHVEVPEAEVDNLIGEIHRVYVNRGAPNGLIATLASDEEVA